MRLYLILSALAVLSLTGCQSSPPAYSGVVYGAPCGYRAVDSGICPHIGYRKAIIN